MNVPKLTARKLNDLRDRVRRFTYQPGCCVYAENWMVHAVDMVYLDIMDETGRKLEDPEMRHTLDRLGF